jgi:sensor histidine kinase YesM
VKSTPESQDSLQTNCTRLEPGQPGETWRDRVRRVAVFAWPFLAIPAVLTALFYNFGWYGWRMIPIVFAVNTLVTVCIGGTIVVLHMVVAKYLARIRPIWLANVLSAVATIGGVVLGSEAAIRSLDLLSPQIQVGVTRGNLIGIGLVIATVIFAIEIVYERLRKRARRVELREEQAQRQALRAQFEALQARTNPHFLYNSLNAVAGLIEEDPKRAEQALEKLSDLFRYALDGSQREHVRLSEELRTVRGYLEMEELRFGERLRYEVDVPADLGNLAVPPLVLQPLVENAVLHGISPRTAGGSVRVVAAKNNGVLDLTVEDDGPGPGGSEHRGSRTSLDDLSKRLELLYAARATLESGPAADGGLRVRVRLPATHFSDTADSAVGADDAGAAAPPEAQ